MQSWVRSLGGDRRLHLSSRVEMHFEYFRMRGDRTGDGYLPLLEERVQSVIDLTGVLNFLW